MWPIFAPQPRAAPNLGGGPSGDALEQALASIRWIKRDEPKELVDGLSAMANGAPPMPGLADWYEELLHAKVRAWLADNPGRALSVTTRAAWHFRCSRISNHLALTSWAMQDNAAKLKESARLDDADERARKLARIAERLAPFHPEVYSFVKVAGQGDDGGLKVCRTAHLELLAGSHIGGPNAGAVECDRQQSQLIHHAFLDSMPVHDGDRLADKRDHQGRYQPPSSGVRSWIMNKVTTPLLARLVSETGLRLIIAQGSHEATSLLKAFHQRQKLSAAQLFPAAFPNEVVENPTDGDIFGLYVVRVDREGPLALFLAITSVGSMTTMGFAAPAGAATAALAQFVAAQNLVRHFGGMQSIPLNASPLAGIFGRGGDSQIVRSAVTFAGWTDEQARVYSAQQTESRRAAMPQCQEDGTEAKEGWRDKLRDKTPQCQEDGTEAKEGWRDKAPQCQEDGTEAKEEWRDKHLQGNRKHARDALPDVQRRLLHRCGSCTYATNNKTAYNGHMISQHGARSSKPPAKCSGCAYTHHEQSTVNRHMKTCKRCN